ncbi:FKBP-type peptidyl-prolyl cis-trans isomerase [Frankia sp. CiP3]|uniref:FKBP-type peptidyl-prolyl cis-trans isomerase n=1 Tax=Frankia sp. CiP3 TaxID=2880971 RepID=UPI001EF749F0|nr:FKBP-type peptidyl-prolyl cis-trans isomerase [Frankia sp. CiP3]
MTDLRRPVKGVQLSLSRAFGGPGEAPITPAAARRLSVALSAVLLACALAACSSSTAPDGTKAAPVRLTDTLGPAASGVGLPAVTGATDLKAKPTIAAGSGTPGTKLLTRDLVVGTGAVATTQSTVSVQYVGTLWTTGEEFDSSWSRGQAAIFPLSGVIPGFQQGIAGMKTGGRREIVIPPDLGYGSTAQGPIPGGSTLVFVVDLVGLQATNR